MPHPASLAAAVGLPQHWGDGAGLDGLDAAHHDELQLEALAAWLQAQHTVGRPFGWLRPDVLLAVNPGRPLAGLHGDRAATMSLHDAAVRHASSSPGDWPAHPFAVGEAAARRAAAGEDACVCVLGESGSGKSECAKLVLMHLLNLPHDAAQTYHMPEAALAAGGAPAHRALGVATLLARSMLEAFTHAAAPANANASRALLATRLTLAKPSGLLIGAKLQLALLHEGRAGAPPPRGHGNFHALHAAAHDAHARGELAGLAPHMLRLLTPAGTPAEAAGAARGASFAQIGGALRALGLSSESVDALRRRLVGLLLLGQLPAEQLLADTRIATEAQIARQAKEEAAALEAARKRPAPRLPGSTYAQQFQTAAAEHMAHLSLS